VCLTEQYWLCGHASVSERLHAFDPMDSNCTIGVYIGLRGVNVTLKARYDAMWFRSTANDSLMLKYNERFDWAWGTKPDSIDYSNPYSRQLTAASFHGLPLPIQSVAERFRAYGPLGSASAGVGLHEAGYYANLCLSCGLAAWVLVGVLPTLSPYASCYAALFSAFFLLAGSILHVVISSSMGTFSRAKIRFQSIDQDDSTMLRVRYGWCMWLNIVTALAAGVVSLFLKKRAEWHSLKMIRVQQEEVEEIEQMLREPATFPSKRVKRRLTVVKSSPADTCPDVIHNVTAVSFGQVESSEEVIQLQNFPVIKCPSEVQEGSDCKIVECDINYTGPETTMLYVSPLPDRCEIQCENVTVRKGRDNL